MYFSANTLLCACCESGTVLGAKDTAVNRSELPSGERGNVLLSE